MKTTVAKFIQHPEKYVNQSIKKPVVLEKSNQPFIVVVPYERYTQLEDYFWGKLATHADQEKPIGVEAAKKFLRSF